MQRVRAVASVRHRLRRYPARQCDAFLSSIYNSTAVNLQTDACCAATSCFGGNSARQHALLGVAAETQAQAGRQRAAGFCPRLPIAHHTRQQLLFGQSVILAAAIINPGRSSRTDPRCRPSRDPVGCSLLSRLRNFHDVLPSLRLAGTELNVPDEVVKARSIDAYDRVEIQMTCRAPPRIPVLRTRTSSTSNPVLRSR